MIQFDKARYDDTFFPMLVLEEVFRPTLYRELVDRYPHPDQVYGGRDLNSNILLQRHANAVIGAEDIDLLWREFFAYHTSQAFLHVLSQYLPIFDVYPNLRQAPVGLRYRDETTIQMDTLFGVNTPVQTPSSVKGPHLDNPRELFASLLYFPVDGDGAGGDLILYRYNKSNPTFYGKRFTDDVEPIGAIPYRPNQGVFFINTPQALHGVAVRKATATPRRYVNVETEVAFPLFEIPG